MKSILHLIQSILHIRIIRFFLVAGLNTLFGVSVYFILRYSGLHYAVAALLGQIISVLFNFKTYGTLVFKNKDNYLIFRFIAVYAFLYLCNITGIWIFKQIYPTNEYMDYIAAVILVIPIGFLGYILNKTFVYHTKKSQFTFDEEPEQNEEEIINKGNDQ
ncbi:MAG: GtrA family protein [Bacteroidales bacterium]